MFSLIFLAKNSKYKYVINYFYLCIYFVWFSFTKYTILRLLVPDICLNGIKTKNIVNLF